MATMDKAEIQARLEKVDEAIGQELRAAVSYHAYVRGGCRQTRQALRDLRAEKTKLEAALTTIQT